MKNILNKILELIYPNTCVCCGKVARGHICEECKEKLIYIKEPRCKKCGKPVRFQEQEYCHDCQKSNFLYERGFSVWLHKGPIRDAIYRFKYHNKRVYGVFFAQELYRLYGEYMKQWEIQALVPVPLHWTRRWKRGYNQAEVLARRLSELSKVKVLPNCMRRCKHTETQKILNPHQRRKNLQGAFCVKNLPRDITRVLVIDDIYTTGSTIETIAEALKLAGVEKVWFLTISIGQDF